MKDEWRVGRVIARPWRGGRRGEFVRTQQSARLCNTAYRADCPGRHEDDGLDVISVGKINDIFCGMGDYRIQLGSANPVHGMEQIIDICKKDFHGLFLQTW